MMTQEKALPIQTIPKTLGLQKNPQTHKTLKAQEMLKLQNVLMTLSGTPSRTLFGTLSATLYAILSAVLLSLLPAACLPSMEAYAADGLVRTVTWEEIPQLVQEGNPTWKAISAPAEREREEIAAACEDFLAELNETLVIIDGELEEIRIRKAELRRPEGSAAADGQMSDVTLRLAEETEHERLLRENRQQVLSRASSAVLPEKNALHQKEESLQPQLEAIVSSVQELYISRQELIAQQEALAALLDAQEVRAKAAAAAFEHGIISENSRTEAQLALRLLRSRTEALDENLKKLERSLKRSLGFDPEAEVRFGPVPAIKETEVCAIDPQADLKKLLENSAELKASEGVQNFGRFGDQRLQQDEVSRIRGELTASVENAYGELMAGRSAAAEAKKDLAEAEKRLALKEKLLRQGKISQLGYLEEKAAFEETKSHELLSELAFRKAADAYSRLTEIKTVDPDAGPGQTAP